MFEKITTEEKSIHIIEFSGKKKDWEGWFKKFFARERHKDYCTLLISADQRDGDGNIPINKEYDQAVGGTSANCKKVKGTLSPQ